jgi:hypothetical protein
VSASLSQSSTIKFEARGSRSINLRDGRDLQTAYVDAANAGTVDAEQLLSSNEAAPLALTSDDFDEDGVPDLVARTHQLADTTPRGNVDSIYPNAPRQCNDAQVSSLMLRFSRRSSLRVARSAGFDREGIRC